MDSRPQSGRQERAGDGRSKRPPSRAQGKNLCRTCLWCNRRRGAERASGADGEPGATSQRQAHERLDAHERPAQRT